MELNIIPENDLQLQAFELQAQIYKVLTHPVRIAILEILKDGEHCVCHMEAFLGLRQAYISQQLSVLREAGLVQDRRDGWNIFYSVADNRIYEILNAVRRLTGQSDPGLRTPKVACTCPKCSAKEKSDS